MFVFGKLISQHYYEEAIQRGHGAHPASETVGDWLEEGSGSGDHGGVMSKACFGPACFQPTAMVAMGFAIVAVGAALLLVCRTAPHYRMLWGAAVSTQAICRCL